MQPADVDLLLHARWLIPIEPADTVLEDHCLVVNDGRIVALLPSAEAGRRYRGARSHRLDTHALLPGLVNAHTHAAMTLMRGMADDLPLMTWLNEHIWPTEARWVDPDYVRAGTRLALLEQLRCGVTCCNDMYFFPEAVADCVREAGSRAVVGLIVIEFPSAYASDADGYIANGLELFGRVGDESRLHFAFAPHAPYTVSEQTLRRIDALSGQHALPIHMHVHETADEIAQGLEAFGCRPLAYLDRIGLLTPRLAAVHMTQLLDEEIELAAATGISVLHCPESNLKLASGFCPVARLEAAGVNVALGTDGAASNNDLDMFSELRSAALLAKAVAGDAAALPASHALRMATLNGARALGLGDRIGSLEPGKQADVIAVDLARPETEPVYHPVSQLVYASSRDQVTHVWVDGQPLLIEREATRFDEARVLADARGWRDRIQRSGG